LHGSERSSLGGLGGGLKAIFDIAALVNELASHLAGWGNLRNDPHAIRDAEWIYTARMCRWTRGDSTLGAATCQNVTSIEPFSAAVRSTQAADALEQEVSL